MTDNRSSDSQPLRPPRPLGLVAELTYRCPLHCPYCSNPVRSSDADPELTADEWRRVLREAADLGILHALFSGGEPLARPDLEQIITFAREAGLYTNLITSAVGLNRRRLQDLQNAGLDSVQISFQSDQPEAADGIAGTAAHALKIEAARFVRDAGLPLTINVVLHQRNIDRIGSIISMADALHADRLELANVQFYGWAFRNRHALLPTQEQIDRAGVIATAERERLAGVMDVLYVMPDYFTGRPKPCMNGWGRRYIAINPHGQALPCPTAFEIRNLRFDSVREHSLEWIWTRSESFNRYRGTDWLPEPCQSCPKKEVDFGGCRCQAFLITGDAGRTDPACGLSPDHRLIREAIDDGLSSVPSAPLMMRQFTRSPS